MKLIFTDIDGVLNSALGNGPYESDMEVDKLKLLKELIDVSKAEGIVITSDRRFSDVDMNHKMDVFDKYEIFVVGTLRRPNEDDMDDNRGKQIMDYINSSKEPIDNIVILDDLDDGISELFFEDFILVDRLQGFTSDVFVRALKVLK